MELKCSSVINLKNKKVQFKYSSSKLLEGFRVKSSETKPHINNVEAAKEEVSA